VEVRRLSAADLAALERGMPSWNRSEYAKRLEAQDRGLLVQVVAWDDGVPVGRGMVLFAGHDEWSTSAHRERCTEVRDVAVLESHRRRGIARAMMAALEDAAREAGMRRVGLSVGTDDGTGPARALYEELGYVLAHGPYVATTTLDGDEGPVPVGAVLVYLTKALEPEPTRLALG
jgi:GNAT superfamily N-acetyltransferase